ncbi:uncharacterized protein LOC106640208 [Copidosoma floridanum]|uniref:uncharacterized protein LOC106640208 n=1 Tax=Copidosoma floridanum TaxID=29053 RepID=UPI000C6F8A82|nr:uncharacterized protein LOC106640208 [Copidosoma floridanum]
MNIQSNMSDNFDNFLTSVKDGSVEQVSKEGSFGNTEGVVQPDRSVDNSKEMGDRQSGNDEISEDSNNGGTENARANNVAPQQSDEVEEIRTEGSADDMDLDETIDSHIDVRMETERQHIQSLPSDDNEEEEDEEDDIGIESVNILDTLPLEGAPIEGQEVTEADLLGKMNDDEDEDDKSLSRSGEEDGHDVKKRRTDVNDDLDSTKKKQKKDEGHENSSELDSKMDKKLSNMRRNIREVMDETQLDEATLSAQRQEMERLQRLQEQQRIIRESQARLPSSVMLKVNSSVAAGSQSSVSLQTQVGQRRPMGEGSRFQRGGRTGQPTSLSRPPGRPSQANALQQRIRMMTPSVSISPVVPKKEPIEHLEYYTDSDLSDVEAEIEDEEMFHEKQMQQARKLAGAPKAKGKDVVTISSSSESSDDDCIVLSDPSETEETDNEDDPSNSGMHTTDRYNIPDDQGRVIVNVGHPKNEPDVFLAPQVARIIKPHQIGGIRFLYDNIVESIERYKTSSGFGCILAHSMGLGKTLQVASFCDIFFRCTDAKTVLCIMPINTLQNWLAEFNMWLPYEATDIEIRPRHFQLHILNDSHKTMAARARVIREWQKIGGVLLIGYELYRQLSLKKPNKAKRKRGQPQLFKDPSNDVEEEDKNKPLLDEMHTALVNPGPDLVICDEGHRIKNSHASISLALKQMRTKRRVVLTGYPLQNNLLEYWCMVDFVRPNYLGTKSEFCNMFERPIQNGQCIDSTPQDIRLMRYRAHVLHDLLQGFVQRRSHSVLQVSLPRKEEYILLVRMTPFQRKLYDTFMNQVVKTRAVPNPLKAFAVCCKIWNHPDVLYHFLKKRQANEEDDLDLEETMGDKTPNAGAKRGNKPRALKGEGKKGKKAIAKNKTTAIAESYASAASSENLESDAMKSQNYTNFGAPAQPSAMTSNQAFSNPPVQNTYLQQQQQQQQPPPQHTGYQNYPQQQQTGNYHANEYNYYGNQNQSAPQKFPATESQNYSQYNQNPSYPSDNQTLQQPQQQQQQYQGQQNYNVSSNDTSAPAISGQPQRFPGPSPTGPSTPTNTSTNFRPDQSQQIGNTATAEGFSRSNYSFQEQDRNYSQNFSQGSNYSQGSHQQQQPNFQSHAQPSGQMAMSEYNPYPPSNQNQNYSNVNSQQMQNNSVNYTSNQQLNQNSNTATGYMSNQQQQSSSASLSNVSGYPQNQHQHMPNPSIQNSSQQSYSSLATQSNQNVPPMQNQSHSYPHQQQQQTNHQQQPYAQSSQIKGYQNMSQTTSPNYGQMSANSNQPNQSIYPNNMHQQSQQSQQQQSQHQQPQQNAYGQPVPGFSQPSQQTQQAPTGQINYNTSQAGVTSHSSQASHGYQTNTQQSQTSQLTQNQALNYPKNSQIPNQGGKNIGQNDQQQQQHSYPRSDSQSTQNHGSNYPMTPSTPSFASPTAQLPVSNQAATNQQQQQAPSQSQDPYWQQNYQNSNDPYYSNPNSQNQYQGNYQEHTATAENYSENQQNQQQNQQNQQYQNFSTNTVTNSKSTVQSVPGQQFQHQAATNTANALQSKPNQPQLQSSDNVPAPVPASNNPSGATTESIPENTQNLNESSKLDDDKNNDGSVDKDKSKEDKSDDEYILKDEIEKDKNAPGGIAAAIANTKELDARIPYDWAIDLMKGYIPGLITASAKMTLFFCILEEAISMGDRILTFSQSLFTLNLIEDFLAKNPFKLSDGQRESWMKNVNYYRLDGSTTALEREKLINEFNVNKKVHLFLVSTRAGSLGINLVGANRAIVFDASWNPCHDTQAVCRVYRYGQQKNCYVYRLVTDNCLERKIYDRQISKQGMADRVVDQCNPDAHLSLKEATTLSWDWEEDSQVQDFSECKDKYSDEVMHTVLDKHSSLFTKEPFHHESLLVDRKEKKLSQAEKRLARRGYELEKMAATCARPSYNYVPGNTAARVSVSAGSLQIRQIRGDNGGPAPKPVASVRPMQQRGIDNIGRNPSGSRWIPAEVWQRQGMSAQEMTLPLDVVIPTNSPDKGSIVLKAGQRVMVLKSPKGIYMQLESGKIIAIRTALKINQQKKEEEPKKSITPVPQRSAVNKSEIGFPLRNNSAISIIPKSTPSIPPVQQNRTPIRTGVNYRPFGEKEVAKRTKNVATAAAKPYTNQINTNQVSLSKINKSKLDNPSDVSSMGENSNSSDGHRMRTDQRVEEVHIDDVVAETGSNSDYSPSSRPSNSDTDSNLQRPTSANKTSFGYPMDNSPARSQGMRTPQDRDYYAPDPKTQAPKKFTDFSRTLDQKKADGSDDVIIENTVQHQQQQQLHLQHQPYLHPHPQNQPQSQPQSHLHQQPHLQQQQQHQVIPPAVQPMPQQTHNISRPQSRQYHSASSTPRVTPDPVIDSSKSFGTSPAPNVPAPVSTLPAQLPRPKPVETSVNSVPLRESTVPGESNSGLPQGYPYSQYSRYYDYGDPRARPIADPYGPYYPPAAASVTSTTAPPQSHPQAGLPRVTPETNSAPVAQPKPILVEQVPKPISETSAYSRTPIPQKSSVASEVVQSALAKPIEGNTHGTGAAAGSTVSTNVRDEVHAPTAFSHPSSVRSAYSSPYPPAPYDPYSQHYPPAPASSAAYAPGATPGYPAYGGPSYNADYARMYSAFHGPAPPAVDPYRNYAPPPASHPSSYSYPPFPHPPPPPYPNYSFLPPYANPNVPTDPQPPAQ